MTADALNFLATFGRTILQCLNNFRIPGTNWSVLGLFLGIFLLGFIFKILSTLFSGFSLSGAFSSIKANKEMKRERQVENRMNKAKIIHFKQEMRTKHSLHGRG